MEDCKLGAATRAVFRAHRPGREGYLSCRYLWYWENSLTERMLFTQERPTITAPMTNTRGTASLTGSEIVDVWALIAWKALNPATTMATARIALIAAIE